MTTLPGSSMQQTWRLQTWPFRRRMVVANGHPPGKLDRKGNYLAELESTRRESLGSIFMTDSSKTIQVNERPHSTTTNIGSLVTTSFPQKSTGAEALQECPICCDTFQSHELERMPCCATTLCSSCLLTHTITSIHNGKGQIGCPACSAEINSSTILYNSEIPASLRERFQQILAQDLSKKRSACMKLCPHCNYITIIDEYKSMKHGKRSRRSPGQWLHCEKCGKEWCWSCYAPSHPNETCRQFKKNHTDLDLWAKTRRTDNNQRNAQRCPKCSIYIEKTDGCDHMACTKCNSKFCYRCGSRMRVPFYIGHDAKYSLFGCKYKLWPNRPVLRWLVRGSICAGVVLLTPVVLSALLALVAVGVPSLLIIGCLMLPVVLCLECRQQS